MHLEEMRRGLMAKHLRSDEIGRQELGLLIDNVNNMIKRPDDMVLRRQFLANLADYEVRHGH